MGLWVFVCVKEGWVGVVCGICVCVCVWEIEGELGFWWDFGGVFLFCVFFFEDGVVEGRELLFRFWLRRKVWREVLGKVVLEKKM